MDILEGKKMIEEKKKIFMYWQSLTLVSFWVKKNYNMNLF